MSSVVTPPPQQPTEILYNDSSYNVIREGLAEILTPAEPDKKTTKNQSVFYNPIQQYNRDLSVLAIRAFAEDFEWVRNQRQNKWMQNAKGKKRKREAEPDAEKTSGQEQVLKSRKVLDGLDVSARNAGNEAGGALLGTGEKDDAGSVKRPEGHDDIVIPSGPKPQRTTPPLKILDALSATGLRALRYGKELPCPTHITANDLSKSATAAIKLNVEHNKLQDKIQISTSDAVDHLHYAGSNTSIPGHGAGPYHVIDLDPYGTAAPFLDSAVRALGDGGLLCVTCTDAGVFASTGYLEKTYSQYGGLPIKGPHAHEGGIRLILHSIATAAARYGISIEPLLSLSIDFYVRIFVRIHKSPAEVKFLASKTMVVYNCDAGCGAWTIQHLAQAKGTENRNNETIYKHTCATGPAANQLCEHCGFKTHVAGPMWAGPLHNPHFINRILDNLPSLDKEIYATLSRIESMLIIALSEDISTLPSPINPTSSPPAEVAATMTNGTSTSHSPSSTNARPIPCTPPQTRTHHPFFLLPASLSRVLHTQTPSDAQLRGALLHLGYKVSRSHAKPGSIVTDAPWSVIWTVMREWVRQKSPIKDDALKPGTAGFGVMQRGKGRWKDSRGTLKGCLEEGVGETEVREKLEGLLYRMGRDEMQETGLKLVFDEEMGKKAQGRKVLRYPLNPAPDWGPMSKAKGGA